jgi:chemotaxis-related protein WspB
MLFLQFRLGQDLLALAAEAIVEIVSLGAVRATRGEGAGMAAFDYRGAFIPVFDLSLRETGQPARRLMSTRILVVCAPFGSDGGPGGLVGLIAEQATTMLRLGADDFAPFARGPDGLVQRVELGDLLPRAMMRGAA